jgi:hypothetical protein
MASEAQARRTDSWCAVVYAGPAQDGRGEGWAYEDGMRRKRTRMTDVSERSALGAAHEEHDMGVLRD